MACYKMQMFPDQDGALVTEPKGFKHLVQGVPYDTFSADNMDDLFHSFFTGVCADKRFNVSDFMAGCEVVVTPYHKVAFDFCERFFKQ